MASTTIQPFHLAIPVHDLAAARAFYGRLFGCPEGRSAQHWVDFDFFGHQLVCHLDGQQAGGDASAQRRWTVMKCRCRISAWCWACSSGRHWCRGLESAGAAFVIAPRVRFRGQAGEQATFFLRDPSGNALEFKAFADPGRLFAGPGDDAVIKVFESSTICRPGVCAPCWRQTGLKPS